MGIHNLERLFNPGAVAVVGDLEDRGSVASQIVRNLSDEGYPGRVCPVYRNSGSVEKTDLFSSIRNTGADMDLVLLAVPMKEVPDLLEQCGRAKAAGAVIISETGRGTGEYSREVEVAVRRVTRGTGLRVIGPCRYGFYASANRVRAWADGRRPPDGRIAFISQSAAVCSSVLDHAVSEGIGLSHCVCGGAMFDVDYGDLIDYLGNEPEVTSIVIHMERLIRHRNFMSAARAVSRVKPVVVLKSGRHKKSDPRPMGAPDQKDAFYDAAFDRAGIVRVQTLEALFDCAELLAKQPRPGGRGLAVVSNGIGPAVMAADALLDNGIMPALLERETLRRLGKRLGDDWNRTNPLCITGENAQEEYCEAVKECLGAREVSGLLVIHAPAPGTEPFLLADALLPLIRKASLPVFAVWMGGSNVLSAGGLLNRAGIPTFPTPERAAAAFAALCRYEKNRKLLHEIPQSVSMPPCYDRKKAGALIAVMGSSEPLCPGADRAGDLLGAYGIEVRKGETVSEGSLELSAGVVKGGNFGRIIYFGAGGRLGEIFPDRSYGLPPLNRLLARRLMEKNRIHGFLAGQGGLSPGCMEELEKVLVSLSQMVVDFPEVESVDMDPLVVGPEGIWAADARVSVDRSGSSFGRHLVISPYPGQYESWAGCKNGVEIFIRPIRPEDARLLGELYASLSARSMYRRFFTIMRKVPDRMLSRFTQIDYDREMAMVAIRGAGAQEEMVGVARIIPEWNRKRGEFAVVTRDAWQGLGVGAALMERLLPIARKMGMETIYGFVLGENTQMLALGEKLGMNRQMGPGAEEIKLTMELSAPAATRISGTISG